MSQKTWPSRSGNHRYAAIPFCRSSERDAERNRRSEHQVRGRTSGEYRESSSRSKRSSSEAAAVSGGNEFASLPDDILTKIAASFRFPELQSASLVCKSWSQALRPLRESMLFLKWGKRYKHGHGVRPNLDKALDSFLKGADRGSTLAMVDAGLIYWEMGKTDEGMTLYKRAAVLGDPAGQCNLAISYLKAEPPNSTEAVKWLVMSSHAGYVRAQYQLALCLHQGQGVDRNLYEAARWYLKAAEGGYVRAMYNISLCYSLGEGLVRNHRVARKWMKRAADRGHSKAQYEHGLFLFLILLSASELAKLSRYSSRMEMLTTISQEGAKMNAVVYLELATRAGETAASHVRDVILQQLSASSQARVTSLADSWRALPSTV